MNTQGRSGALAGWVAFLVCLVSLSFLLEMARPLPFATTDDNWMYSLPLILAHTEAALQASPLRVLWSAGAGWEPLHSGQIGYLYPVYHISRLIAEQIDSPLVMFEVSAVVHMALNGVVTMMFAPPSLKGAERGLWAGVAASLTGPLILGMNWHMYLAAAPWFLALFFIWSRNIDKNWGRQDRVVFLVLGLLFFLASHVQMFVIGIALLCFWQALAARDLRRALPGFWMAGVLTLTVAVPLLYLKLVVSAGATTDWMQGRTDSAFLLRAAQPLSVVLPATLTGNLVGEIPFVLWGTDISGSGIFFNIPLVVLAGVLIKTSRFRMLAGVGLIVALISAADFAVFRYFAIGPFAGFRWTWKLVAFSGPLFLGSFLVECCEFKFKGWIRKTTPLAIFMMSTAVSVNATNFDILPAMSSGHGVGATGIVSEAKTCFARLLEPGSRLALIGTTNMTRPLPLPVLAMLGNAPLLAGYETAHLYEPMESQRLAAAHGGLGLPWRTGIEARDYVEHRLPMEADLMAIGVNGLVTMYGDIFPQDESTVSCVDSAGGTTWIRRLSGRATYPSGTVANMPVELVRLPDGTLRIPAIGDGVPEINSPIPMHFTRIGAHWHGRPVWPWGWMALGAAAVILAITLAYAGIPSALLRYGSPAAQDS